MQNNDDKNLPLRSRYYQAEIDLASLKLGDEYEKLQPLFVIFVCSFDPFDKNLYRYTFEMQCQERDFLLNDGVKRIFLNTKGTNKNEVSPVLVDFLGYLEDSTDSYVNNLQSEKIKKIHEKIVLLKKDRNLEERYMRLEEEFKLREKEGHKKGMKEAENKIFSLMNAMKQNNEEHLISLLSEDQTFYEAKLKEYHL